MGDYKEFRDYVRDRVAVLNTKTRALNGRLKDTIRALSRDPKPQPEGQLKLDKLQSLNAAIREVHGGTLLPKFEDHIGSMEEADRKLAVLDEDIGRGILVIHSSILAGNGIPEAESERLQGMFKKWQSTMEAVQSHHRSLRLLKARLEQAIESADAFAASSCRNAAPLPSHTTAGEHAADAILRAPLPADCTAKEIAEARNLLLGIMSMYLQRSEPNLDMRFCCSRVACCRLAEIPSPAPIKYHIKDKIKTAVKSIESKLKALECTGQALADDLELFFPLPLLCRKLHLALPEDFRRQELLDASSERAIAEGFIFQARVRLNGEGAQLGSPSPRPPRFVRGITGYDRIFMLEYLERKIKASSIHLQKADPAELVKNDAVLDGIASSISNLGRDAFYSRAEVTRILDRFSLQSFAPLIPEMSFIHELAYSASPERLVNFRVSGMVEELLVMPASIFHGVG